MLAKLRARQDHQRLMRAAHNLLRDAAVTGMNGASKVTAQDLSAYAFGRLRIDLPIEDAQRYLDAARVSRGERINPAPATA
jgi:hypothetical protein